MTELDRTQLIEDNRESGFLERIPPWLTLLILAPVLGELVSCHQTPLEFFNPLNFVLLALPYGFGALICRELTVRWGGGGLSLLLLGVAYGVFEEGIVVYSLFDPHWSELGPLAQHGFYAGVNWTWALVTVQFHALISIGSSVTLAHVIYYDRRTRPWLGKRGLIICVVGLLAWIPALGTIMITQMKRSFPPWHLYVLAWGLVLVLAMMARRIAGRPKSRPERAPARPLLFFLLGFLNITVLFVGVFGTAEWGAPAPIVTVPLLLIADGVSLWLLWRWSGSLRSWDDRHRLALVAGLLAFFVLFSFAKDAEQWHGTSIVGLLTMLGLWLLGRTVRRRQVRQVAVNPDKVL